MGANESVIGVLIQTVFESFFDLGIGLKKWVKMGKLISAGLSLIGSADTLLLDTHFAPISKSSRVEFLGCFEL